MTDAFDPYHKWLGIPPKDQPPHHYRLLGIEPFESDLQVIELAADRQMTHVRTFQAGSHSEASQKLLNELAAARVCLLSKDKKTTYDETLRSKIDAYSVAPTVSAPAQPAASSVVPESPPTAAVPRVAAPDRGSSVAIPGVANTQASQPIAPVTPSAVVAEPGVKFRRPVSGRRSSPIWQHPAVLGLLCAGVVVLVLIYILNSPAVEEPSARLPVRTQMPVRQPAETGNGVERSETTNGRSMAVLEQGVGSTSPKASPVAAPVGEPFSVPSLAPAPVEPAVEQDIPTGLPAESGSRQAIPDQSAIDTATTRIEETYQEEFSQAKTPLQAQALARRLIDVALKTKEDPAAVYVLLHQASALASQSGHYQLAAEALDHVAQKFVLDDLLARKETALVEAAKRAETTADFRLVARSWARLAEDAVSADRYEHAVRMAEAAEAAVRRSRDEVYQSVLAKRFLDLRTIQKTYERFQVQQQGLETDVTSAEVNLALGRFCCLYKGDWEAAFPLLAEASDSALKQLAMQDSALPTSPADQLKLADAWRQLAEEESEPIPARLLRARAAHWYQNALPALSGPAKTQAEKQILASQEECSPIPVGEWLDVLSSVDLARHTVAGKWHRDEDEIRITKPLMGARFRLPVLLPGSYELAIHFTVEGGWKEVFIILPIGGRRTELIVGGWTGITALHRVNGKPGKVNGSKAQSGKLAIGERYRLGVQVTLIEPDVAVVVDLQGRELIRWQGPKTALSMENHRPLYIHAASGIVAQNTTVTIHSARLRVTSHGATLVEDDPDN